MSDTALLSAYTERGALLGKLAERLDDTTRQALDGVPHIDRIYFRVKDPESFLKKAVRYTNPLAEVEDQIAGRVITFFRDDIQRVRKQVTKWFGDVEHVIKEPEGATEFGYESDHYIFVIAEHLKPEGWLDYSDMPATFELQIRTLFMHAWAEPQHDLGYKGQASLDRETARELAWVAASSWGADRTLNEIARRLKGSAPETRPTDLPDY